MEKKKSWKGLLFQESSFVSSWVKKICVITIYQVHFEHLDNRHVFYNNAWSNWRCAKQKGLTTKSSNATACHTGLSLQFSHAILVLLYIHTVVVLPVYHFPSSCMSLAKIALPPLPLAFFLLGHQSSLNGVKASAAEATGHAREEKPIRLFRKLLSCTCKTRLQWKVCKGGPKHISLFQNTGLLWVLFWPRAACYSGNS